MMSIVWQFLIIINYVLHATLRYLVVVSFKEREALYINQLHVFCLFLPV